MTLPFSGGLLGFGSSATQGASPFHWVELGRKKLTSDGDRVLVTGAEADAGTADPQQITIYRILRTDPWSNRFHSLF